MGFSTEVSHAVLRENDRKLNTVHIGHPHPPVSAGGKQPSRTKWENKGQG